MTKGEGSARSVNDQRVRLWEDDIGKKCENIGARFREALLGLRRIICIHLLFIVVRARLVETLVTAVVC